MFLYMWKVILTDLCTGEPVAGLFHCGLHTVCCAIYLHQVTFLESFRWGLSSLRARWYTYIAFHRSDGYCNPVRTMFFRCVFGGSIGRGVDFWLSLLFSESLRGLEARQFGASRLHLLVRLLNLLSSGHHYRWAVILADLCTGELVAGLLRCGNKGLRRTVCCTTPST